MKLELPTAIAFLVFALLLAGCATPYQANGFRGGYKDVHIQDNIYYVTFFGNAWIDTGTAVQYFHRRAKELCAQKGFGSYRTLSEKDASQYLAIANGGMAQTMEKPVYGGQVECLQ
jgi:hypothetical protein